MCREIAKQTKSFWLRVESARKCLTQKFEAERNFNTKKVKEIEAELMRLEPETDASDGLATFLKEKYRNAEPHSERMGTLEELEIARKHAQISTKIKKLGSDKQLVENSLKSKMRDIERITFGESGSVIWKNDASGVRRFQNKIIEP